jgi:hypothetical protein
MSSFLGVPVDAAYHLVCALTSALTPVLGGLSAVVGIIIFTMAVRLLIAPLSFRALRGQAAQARLAPQLAALRQRYGKQPERFQRELAALYQREGTSLLAGLWPILAQWPFLTVMYLLRHLRHPGRLVLAVGASRPAHGTHVRAGTHVGAGIVSSRTRRKLHHQRPAIRHSRVRGVPATGSRPVPADNDGVDDSRALALPPEGWTTPEPLRHPCCSSGTQGLAKNHGGNSARPLFPAITSRLQLRTLLIVPRFAV